MLDPLIGGDVVGVVVSAHVSLLGEGFPAEKGP